MEKTKYGYRGPVDCSINKIENSSVFGDAVPSRSTPLASHHRTKDDVVVRGRMGFECWGCGEGNSFMKVNQFGSMKWWNSLVACLVE